MAVNNPDTALISLASFKAGYRTIDDDGKDQTIAQVITGVSGMISNWCGRRFMRATSTDELYSGDGSDRLYLNQWPISAVASIYVDGNHKWAASTLLTEDDDSTTGDYRFETTEPGWGCVYRLYGSAWPRGVQNIKVTYTAGYATTAPDAIELAAFKLTARWFDIADGSKDSVKSISYPLGAGSTTVVGHEMPKDVVELLQPFRRYRY